MQSAAGSLRGAGPSKCIKCKNSSLWGVGSDNLALSGHFLFRVVKGAVSVNGVTLPLHDPSDFTDSSWYKLSAPVAPYPVFTPAHGANDRSMLELQGELDSYTSVIEVKPSTIPLNISSLAPPYKSLWHDTTRVENSSQVYIDIPQSWAEVSNANEHHFLVLGPKNSGKSTLSRYICNRTLGKQLSKPSDKRTKVYYLELDPGQPEFTPPGCLTLHLVKDYSFSPAYAHADFRNLIKSHHLGYTSPMATPRRYLDMCQDLLMTFRSQASNNDYLIINTPGWTKGLGLELNTEIYEMMDPTKLCAVHMGQSDFDLDLIELEKIEQANSPESITTITTSGFSSAELRTLQIMSYLHQNSAEHLTTWAPYDLSLGVKSGGVLAIGVMDSIGTNLPEDLDICIEGTLVSINIVDPNQDISPVLLADHEADNLWQCSTCVGMGVVQSLGADLKSVRLLTPIDPESMVLGSRKIVLLRGRIALPVWELYSREFQESPWVSTTKAQGTGATYTKFRRNIKRN